MPKSDKKILVVEDDPDTQFVTSFVLRTAGYSVVSVSNRDAALETMKTSRPDVIVMDYRMDGMPFNEFLVAAIKSAMVTRLILLSANATEIAKRYSLRYFLSKPYDVEELEAIISRCLAGGSSAFMPAVIGKISLN